MRNEPEDRAYHLIVGCCILLLLVGCGAFLYGKLGRYPDEAAVQALRWRRVILVERFKTLHQDTLRSAMPADAYNVHIYEDCVPQYDSDGDFTGYDCNTRARYDIDRWVWDHDLTTAGDIREERVWPAFTPSEGQFLGAEREQRRREIFAVHFGRAAGVLVYETEDYNVWSGYHVGQRYALEMNRMEEPIWDSLKLVDVR